MPPRTRRTSSSITPAWRPRIYSPIKLDDQGAYYTVPPSLFPTAGRDQSWNSRADNFLQANRPQLNALEVEAQFVSTSDEIQLRLKPGGTIGAVPLRAPDTHKITTGLIVKPRFGWSGIGPLLQYIGWAATPHILEMPLVPGSAREVPTWVLAGPILRRLGKLLQDMRRGFSVQEEIRQMPRGQILWQRYITNHVVHGALHQLPCRYTDLEYDRLLRAYLRWGFERVYLSLLPYAASDVIARSLADQTQILISQVQDVAPRAPDRRSLQQILQTVGLPSDTLRNGLQALGWIVDERGLAGETEIDGLAWRLTMYELFERWVGHLVAHWAKAIGGEIRAGYRGQTNVPIDWSRRSIDALSSLIPDFVVRCGSHIFIFDAKYKGHFEEFDEQRWLEMRDDLHEQHRHDVHQVLAYAALFEADAISAALVYPMRLHQWIRLTESNQTIISASLTHAGRQLDLKLIGVPIELSTAIAIDDIVRNWSRV
jgi:hypothetical protein